MYYGYCYFLSYFDLLALPRYNIFVLKEANFARNEVVNKLNHFGPLQRDAQVLQDG